MYTSESKGRFTIYANVDVASRNNVAGIELKSNLTYSCVITPAERRITYIVNPPLQSCNVIKFAKYDNQTNKIHNYTYHSISKERLE